MKQSVKFAVSIPDREFQELEGYRLKEGVTRSQLVLEALKLWKKTREKNKEIKIYREGYRRIPEEEQVIAGWEKAVAESFSEGDW
jgi:metal-responsive CopG/Arc/MetJ family transcriptional regulator